MTVHMNGQSGKNSLAHHKTLFEMLADQRVLYFTYCSEFTVFISGADSDSLMVDVLVTKDSRLLSIRAYLIESRFSYCLYTSVVLRVTSL